MSTAHAPLRVVAAIIRDAAGRVLLARRPAHLHQGGLWEFPGGKLEPGETAAAALRRELREELGIEADASRPFTEILHQYADLAVHLLVREVDAWRGEPRPLEGQVLRWADPATLLPGDFPAADVPLLTALRLPPHYVIADDAAGAEAMLERLDACLARGERLIQWRAKRLSAARLDDLVPRAAACCRAVGAQLLVNAEPEQALAWGAAGVHLTAARLLACRSRPLPEGYWVAASCHAAGELAHARQIGVDFVTLSPLRATASHPGALALGWQQFGELARCSGLLVFALGGVGPNDLDEVRKAGAFGVAGIRAFGAT